MVTRIASFNLENLFTRPSAMMMENEEGQRALDDHALANLIVAKPTYSEADKQQLLALDARYHFSALNPPANALVRLNKVRGQLYRTAAGTVSVAANGRGDWTGWFELRRDDVSWQAVLNTGRVIQEVKPDILICVEVEDRPTLQRFNDQVLGAVLEERFPHVMVIDGNDARGIDVGLLSRYPIVTIRSHVDDRHDGKLVFSRDCPEYVVALPSGEQLVICPNHFKSKRGGNDQAAQARRLAQCKRAAQIARAAEKTIPWVLVGGDLNDTPDSPAVAPLLLDGWSDIQSHPGYPADRPGTFATGTASNKIDYLIMSKALREQLVGVGIERRGSYHPKLWPSFAGVTATTEASDHHCIWADFDIA
ncbi:endonuclease/exonuclease/phosphatase family protein [Pseudomonas sp. RIT623]|uniref:endonuclease/exonuclease/phosphatase family protein n=1 Tax=Pseudomonas sp. RIT623 TaxID=2559075 RepID=UPI00106F1EFF|nr:endonuclease/exonuclease/phosphatase family protein [Pseudomonas sp. RIT623]TFF39914.1 endonuclease/exonuclease/phosphatase family protein [Pseudomonas sp. RIT623]